MLRLHEYRYHQPATLAEALALIAAHPGRALPIAGGTDLMPNMKHGLFTPEHVIALRQLPELQGIGEEDGELVIGAGETLATVAQHPDVRARFPSLAQAAGLVAGPQLRNMGTIGGNLCLDTRCTYYNQSRFWRGALGYCLKKEGTVCHVTRVGRKCVAAHSADTPPVLITLDATVELASPRGTRTVPVAEFFVADGIANTVRGWDEILTRVRIPLRSAGLHTGFQKLRQRASIDFPLLMVAAAAALDGDVIRSLRVVVSALGARPRLLTGLERLEGRPLDAAAQDAVAERAFQQCHPLENIIVDPEWRRAMVPVYVRRTLAQLMPPAAPAAGALPRTAS